jgi:hypothetical protein
MHVSVSVMDWIPFYLEADGEICSNMYVCVCVCVCARVVHYKGYKCHEICHGIVTCIDVYKALNVTKQLFAVSSKYKTDQLLTFFVFHDYM